MGYAEREYPLFSACGLNCGLCPRYHTEGTSKCPGCGGEGFLDKHPSCGVLSCCQRKQIDCCYECGELPCKKVDNADQSDSFITHKNQLTDLAKVKKIGIEAYKAELNEKVKMLQKLLDYYDDGRRKSFFCVVINLLPLCDIEMSMFEIGKQCDSVPLVKERATIAVRFLQARADKRGIDLKLRKKGKGG